MSDFPYSDGLLEWASRLGYSLVSQGDEWHLSDGQIDYILLQDENMITLLVKGERSSTRDFILQSADVIDAERYMTCEFGFDMRTTETPMIAMPYITPIGLSPNYRMITIACAKVALISEPGGVRCIMYGGVGPSAYQANSFSWIADASVEDIRASYLDPEGMPLFSGYRMDNSTAMSRLPECGSEMVCPNSMKNLRRIDRHLVESPFSVEFLDWAGLAGNVLASELSVTGKTWTFYQSFFQSWIIIKKEESRWIVTETMRDTESPDYSERFIFESSSLADVERVLTFRFGFVIRWANGLRAIAGISHREPVVNPQYLLQASRSSSVSSNRIDVLDKEGMWRASVAGFIHMNKPSEVGTFEASELSWIIDVPIDVLRKSFLDPEGLPVFPNRLTMVAPNSDR